MSVELATQRALVRRLCAQGRALTLPRLQPRTHARVRAAAQPRAQPRTSGAREARE